MNWHLLCSFLCLMSFLIPATVTDIKRREIPIVLFAPVILAIAFFHYYYHVNVWTYVIGGFLFGLLYFLEAAFLTGSGGDILLAAAIGFTFGVIDGMICMIINGILVLAYFAYQKASTKDITLKSEFPLAPFLCASSIITFVLELNHLIPSIYIGGLKL